MRTLVVFAAALAGAAALAAGAGGCRREAPAPAAARAPVGKGDPVDQPKTGTPAAPSAAAAVLTEAEFRRKLTPEQYRVLRQGGTEAPDSGAYLHHKADGTYLCAACGNPLYRSTAKFDAGGWPSFSDALPGAIVTRGPEGALEALCAKCGSHLGHVFNDGPAPTGRRHWINSVCLQFVEAGK